jgi:HD-GYP domain-containing protein (c-di-GMP phosphodiesterase class II)
VRFLLLHSAGWNPAAIAEALAAEQVEVRPLPSPNDLKSVQDGRPAVIVLDPESRSTIAPLALGGLVEGGVAIVALGRQGEDDVPAELPADLLAGFVRAPAGPRQLLVALRNAFRVSAARLEAGRARAETAARTSELTELAEIGMRLTTEKNYQTLLNLILSQARRITQSDAGSLYIVEADEHGGKRLHFMLTQNDSRPDIPFVEFTIPMDPTSLAGYAATEGTPLVIDDVYDLPPDVAYSFNRSFDERSGYRTKSMLVIPMQNHQGDVIGVLQLINRKREAATRLTTPAEADRQIVPFSPHTVKLVKAMAGQAAVSIENSQLYEAIERLFEGFVRAAVTAIEQRDPTTSGHSERVAEMTVGLAKVVDRADDGAYRSIRFSPEQVRELRYAGLLHDFGKVGVREKVLVKANKLYPSDLDLIQQRHAFALRTAQWHFERDRAKYLEERGRAGYDEFVKSLQARFDEEAATLDRFLRLVLESNKPNVLAAGNFEALHEFAERTFESIDGTPEHFLSPNEVRFLSIRKGSLDDEERLEIESHVTHTFGFLRKIPWTRELGQVADIAYGHHEKLNGIGYPRGVAAGAIPIQTRMMTISDIFDALTAQDRPYKRALPAPKALDILHEEVQGGMLDGELFRLFVAGKVWEGKGPGA